MKMSFRSMVLPLLLSFATASWAQPARNENAVRSPEIGPDNSVTFRIRAPKADAVALVGNWMARDESVPLMKNTEGLWSVTVGPLEPELYGYRFMVDDVSTLDPANLEIKRDGTFRVESVLFVSGKGSDLYAPKAGPKGTVRHVWYDSPTLDLV